MARWGSPSPSIRLVGSPVCSRILAILQSRGGFRSRNPGPDEAAASGIGTSGSGLGFSSAVDMGVGGSAFHFESL